MLSATEKKMKSDGIFSAIKALKEKLAELERRQNEREKNRGFSEGGASVKSSDEKGAEDEADIANQIAALSEQLEGFEEKAAEIADPNGDVEGDDPSENTNSISPTADGLEAVAEQYRAWGIDCEVGVSESGDAAIVVKNSGEFLGKNLLEMSSDSLDKMVSEIGNPGNSPRASEVELISGQTRGGETPPH